jgi:predicted MarR family transcription regulator
MPKKSVPAADAPAARSAAASPIVSSAHLVSPQSAELSEFEFGLIVAGNAFHRWITHCMSAAGLKDLTPLDVLLLHHVNHRARNKKLADICFVLNYEDTHVVAYSLKKLVTAGLVQAEKSGKEVFYSPTTEGEGHVQRYRGDPRGSALIDALESRRWPEPTTSASSAARMLRVHVGCCTTRRRARRRRL